MRRCLTIFLMSLSFGLAYPKDYVEVKATYYTHKVGSRTADGSKINHYKLKIGKLRWVALSRDLLACGFHFGDTIYVECDNPYFNGGWVVKDKMGERKKTCIDFLIHHDVQMRPPKTVKIWKKKKE